MVSKIVFRFYCEKLGKCSNLTCAYFSTALVQPPTRSRHSQVCSFVRCWIMSVFDLDSLEYRVEVPPSARRDAFCVLVAVQ